MRHITALLAADASAFEAVCAEATTVSPATIALITRARTTFGNGGAITRADWARFKGSRKGGFRSRSARVQAAPVVRVPEAVVTAAYAVNARIDARALGRAEVGAGFVL